MKWYFLKYAGKVVPHVCHPYAVKARIDDVKLSTPTDTLYIDLGGMCKLNEPIVTVELPGGRKVEVPEFQAGLIAAKLKLMQCEDGDVHVALVLPGHGFIDVEFCAPGAGGGRSPKTWRALVELLKAMQADDEADARRA